jgi:uncharacterized MAPEG superfamily protein
MLAKQVLFRLSYVPLYLFNTQAALGLRLRSSLYLLSHVATCRLVSPISGDLGGRHTP